MNYAVNSTIFEDLIAQPVAAPSIDVTKKIHALWSEAANGSIPKREELGAERLGELMPYVYIIEILDGGSDFRVRFMGSAIVQSLGGQDYTGKRMSETPDHQANWRRQVYKLVQMRAEPVFTHVSLEDFERGHVMTECALMPLANRDGVFNMILCCAGVVEPVE